MNDPIEKARKAGYATPSYPKRFYETVSVVPEGDGFGVLLDKAPVRTPLKRALVLPNEDLAEVVAGEWRAHEEYINPYLMPLSRLANSAIDQISDGPEQVIDEICGFVGTDMLCYRADEPDGLVASQKQHWDPVLRDIEQMLDVKFVLINGINHQEQSPDTMRIFKSVIAMASPFQIAAMQLITTLTGSGLLAYGLYGGALTQSSGWDVAHVDEDWQILQWGADAEARDRRAGRLLEFNAACNVFRLS